MPAETNDSNNGENGADSKGVQQVTQPRFQQARTDDAADA
jgi:hypothetical protein